ncbi:MAG: DUF3365 domain-containing protein [Pseudanabaenales cyanobacterium]|nr:DUF3365 domain-containing protein [Pseudanabaenales cyanobacterium]
MSYQRKAVSVMAPWSLGAKFSLLLALVCILGGCLTTFILAKHLNYQAEQAVKERAEIFLTAMQAARNYTQDNIQPLLEGSSELGDGFIQESVPNFAARTIFSDFQRQDADFQNFVYKEAALNPTNPLDRTDEFEAQIFTQLQQQLTIPEPQILSGYRALDGENLFYLARPLIMNNTSCLTCHGDPRNAPKHLIEMYGDQNGFRWKLNDVVAAQMVYVPADKIFDRGRQNLLTVTKTLLSIFGALFLVINRLLWRTVIQPLKILTSTAKHISSCSVNQRQNTKLQAQDLDVLTIRQDEPGQLARAFQYMIHVLSQREQDLQQAVHERTQSLEQEMRDRQTAQDALQTYSHAINHDLRNLVMGISSLVQGILFRTSRADDTAASSNRVEPSTIIKIKPAALTMIQKSCDRQLKLMNSLMEVQSSDVWRIALQFEPIDLSQLTEDLKIAYEAKLLAADATLENHISAGLPMIQADANQLQRVFENLIDNALKYNPKGVAIALNATMCNGDQSMISCTVSDNGIGVDPRKSEELFKIYSRGYASRQTSGYGLGLYICRKIVEAHGGNIGVKTLLNGGAEFWFTLPLSGSQ